MSKILVTGGAGFIGSHLCDWLAEHNSEITILDSFSSGSTENIQHLLKQMPRKVKLLKGDCTNPTYVQGALITAYAHTYNFKAIIYRLANIVGPRNKHGVIHDFTEKLRKNPRELEILGDGTQTKSYLYITDCIKAMLLGIEKAKNQIEIYNVGSEEQITVKTIAQIIIQEMKLKNVKLTYTGGIDEGRGWKGDVKNMLLNISKIKSLGWKPKLNSRRAIRITVRTFIQNRSER